MVDFNRLADTAKRLVEKNGRDVTIVKFETTPADSSKPWDGAADPRSPAEDEFPGKGCFVQPSSAIRLGLTTNDSDLVKRSDQILLFATGKDAQPDLSKHDEIIDSFDGSRWKIMASETLRPADVTLLYFFGVKR